MAKTQPKDTVFIPYALPDFCLPATAGADRTFEVSASGLKGQWAVIFLYPTDDTETCRNENIAFTAAHAAFTQRGVKLFGLSPDSIVSHEKFMAKRALTVPLISDEHRVLIEALKAWIEKTLYGRNYMGVDRSTYLISPQGQVVAEWRAVRIKSHTDTVLATIDQLKGNAS